ncbi:cell wall anchor protein [Phytohabitans flavus]|uniref:cell wall anchor protein n=1 Tax=Phytohabitans flavus TaxID=1076124 RepID=UPI00362783D5
MNVRTRALAFAGAAAIGFVAAGALAAPALAAGSTDLSLTLSGTTLAATTSGKLATASVTNKGTETATGIVITFDLSDLDTDVVSVPSPDEEACEQDGSKFTCGVVDLKPGQNADLPFVLIRVGDGEPGSVTATVAHEGEDPEAGNNKATAKVNISDTTGPDLTVLAPDVPIEEGGIGTVAPGEQAELFYRVANFGDEAVHGLKLTIQLPEHVTFVEQEDGCEYDADNRKATCGYDFGLIPADEDSNTEDELYSLADFVNLIKVAEDAPAPAVLDGGVVSAEGIVLEKQPEVAAQRITAAALPEGVEGGSAKDVGESDNTDEFSVHVAKAGGGGGGGELPVTGVQAGLIGGVGLLVVAGGGTMLLMARRRRVVLAVPDDEKPTA